MAMNKLVAQAIKVAERRAIVAMQDSRYRKEYREGKAAAYRDMAEYLKKLGEINEKDPDAIFLGYDETP